VSSGVFSLVAARANQSATCLSTNSVFVSVSPRTLPLPPPSSASTPSTRWDATGSCRESESCRLPAQIELIFSYTDNSFTSCDADAAYPPGLYPIAGGGTSTFAQRYTGTYTADGSVGTFTVGQTVTPSTPFSIPASSNCVTYSTVGNGVNAVAAGATTSASSGASSMASGSMASSMSGSAASAASGASKSAASAGSAVKSAAQSGASAASSAAAKSGASYAHGVSYGSVVGGLASVVAVFAGAGALFL